LSSKPYSTNNEALHEYLPITSNTSLSKQLPAQEKSSKSLFKPLLNMSDEKNNRPSHVHSIKKRNVSSTAVATLMKKKIPKVETQ